MANESTPYVIECGLYRAGSDLAQETAERLGGFYLSKDCSHVVCDRESATQMLDDEGWVIMWMPR